MNLPRITLQGTQLQVSRLCYGTNAFGTAVDQPQVERLLDAFLSLGGNFIDTARSYGDWIPDAPKGASERAIGRWLKSRKREEVVLATKGGFMDLRAGNWLPRVNPACIRQDLTESLEHLGVSSIDLYWLHADDPSQPVAALIDALIAEQKAGRIRYFGASNWTPARIVEAQAYAKSKGHVGFAAIQPFWGLAVPNREAAAMQGYGFYYEDGLQAVHAAGLPVVAYAGQSNGVFTKLATGGESVLPEALATKYLNDATRARLRAVQALASQHGVSVNAIVLAYLLNQPHQTIPIIGAGRVEQLQESVEAVKVRLSTAELERLRSAG